MSGDPFSELLEALRREGGVVSAVVDKPLNATDGEWWADLVIDSWGATVSWRSSYKFGIYTSGDAYGLKPDEVYLDAKKAALRLLQLRKHAQRTRDLPTALTLKDIRLLSAVSQEAIAERLRKNQAEVSRLEAREDAKLSTISEFVQALGGTLELSVRFDDFSGPLSLRSSARPNGRARNAA